MSGSCKTTERSRPPLSQIWAHFFEDGIVLSSEGRCHDSKDRTFDLTALLAFDCVAARQACSSAGALLVASNSATRFSSAGASHRSLRSGLHAPRSASWENAV